MLREIPRYYYDYINNVDHRAYYSSVINHQRLKSGRKGHLTTIIIL